MEKEKEGKNGKEVKIEKDDDNDPAWRNSISACRKAKTLEKEERRKKSRKARNIKLRTKSRTGSRRQQDVLLYEVQVG